MSATFRSSAGRNAVNNLKIIIIIQKNVLFPLDDELLSVRFHHACFTF